MKLQRQDQETNMFYRRYTNSVGQTIRLVSNSLSVSICKTPIDHKMACRILDAVMTNNIAQTDGRTDRQGSNDTRVTSDI